MAVEFSSSVTYALQKLGTPDLVLKPEQRTAINVVYNGRDVFVWLPTGFGKSLCFHTLPFVFDYKLALTDVSAVLVITPLIALMVDQVRSLRSKGVKASVVTSGTTTTHGSVPVDLLATESSLLSDCLLFCTPESVLNSKWRSLFEKPSISDRIVTVVVDEAHCISKW